MSQRSFELEVKVGVFVTVGLGLIAIAILVLGSTENFMSRKVRFTSHFEQIDGLLPGSKVVLGGIPVGTVDRVALEASENRIRVEFNVTRESVAWVREGTQAEIATQGVLGDKYVALILGPTDAKPLAENSEIPVRVSGDLKGFVNKGDQLLTSLNSIAGNLDEVLKSLRVGKRNEQIFDGLAKTSQNLALVSASLKEGLDSKDLKLAVKNLSEIMAKINRGEGSIGSLINDPGLYDDVKSLVGGANRSRVMRNLVRQTILDKEKETAVAEAAGGAAKTRQLNSTDAESSPTKKK